MRDLHDIVREWQARRNESFALATLVRAQGSSYRRPGARMLIDADGLCVGSLSGGCLEEEVGAHARAVLRHRSPKLVSFDTRRLFGCNGAIDILIEPASAAFLNDVREAQSTRRPFAIATDSTQGSRLLRFDEVPAPAAFVQQINPPVRLILFGDGPDSGPLRELAQTIGWEVCECAQASELPGRLDQWTAVLIKSHNYGRDYAALQTVLPLDLRYVGLVGPRARRDQLLGDLVDRGVVRNADLYAPAGLDLAAEGPEEIALAIISEIQRVFTHSTAESLRHSKSPIHGRQASCLPRPTGFQPVG